MAALQDAIVGSFAARYDQNAKGVSELILAEVEKIKEDVKAAKVATALHISSAIEKEQAKDSPNEDVIAALTKLLMP